MHQAAISASRTLRSALDQKILSGSSRTPPINPGASIVGIVLKKNEESSSLSARLSQRLVSTGAVGISTSRQNGTRALSTRTKKKRTGKLEGKKNETGFTKFKKGTSIWRSSNAQPQWTAVGAALTSLEESIGKTNMLLQSLASSETLARRTRLPRLSWDQKASLDSASPKKSSAPALAAKALTALLQELGQKQAVAATLLSRLSEPPRPVAVVPPPETTFDDVFAAGSTNRIPSITDTRNTFESGWGNDGKSQGQADVSGST